MFKRSIVFIAVIAMTLSACGGASPTPPEATKPPKLSPTLKPTTIPTSTPTPEPTPDKTATAEFEATQLAESQAEEVRTVLDQFGIDERPGKMGWYYPDDVEMLQEQWNRVAWSGIAGGQEFENYILHMNVKWDTTSGLAGCGFIFHAEENIREGDYYRFRVWRLSGLPLWSVQYYQNGSRKSDLSGSGNVAKAIDQENHSSNEYLFIVDGSTLTIYANGEKIGTVTILTLNKGQLALTVFQESGETTCTYSNLWIWELTE